MEEKQKRRSEKLTRDFFTLMVFMLVCFGLYSQFQRMDYPPRELWDNCEIFNPDGIGVRIEAYRQQKLISERYHRIFFYTANGQTWHEWWREYEDGVGAVGADCERMTIIDRNLVFYFWEFAITGSVRFYDGKEFYQVSGWDLTDKNCLIIEVHFENVENGEIKLRCPDYDQDEKYAYLIAKSDDSGKTWTLANENTD